MSEQEPQQPPPASFGPPPATEPSIAEQHLAAIRTYTGLILLLVFLMALGFALVFLGGVTLEFTPT